MVWCNAMRAFVLRSESIDCALFRHGHLCGGAPCRHSQRLAGPCHSRHRAEGRRSRGGQSRLVQRRGDHPTDQLCGAFGDAVCADRAVGAGCHPGFDCAGTSVDVHIGGDGWRAGRARGGVLPMRLSALHEAAGIDVLCVDKTGTPTRNELAEPRRCGIGGAAAHGRR